MNNELLLLIKKHTDTLIEEIKTRPQETLDFKMNKQMQTFSFNPPIILVEQDKWLIGVTSLECTISAVFNITNENNSFSITIPGHWDSESAKKAVEKLKGLLELDKKELSLHIAAVREKGRKINIGEDENDLSDLDNSLLRKEIIEKLLKINILTTTNRLQTWKIVQDASMSTSIEIHIDLTSISTKVRSVCLLVLPINHTMNIDILKIWFIDYS